VTDPTRPAAGDERYRDLPPNQFDQLEVVARLGAIGVHGVQQNLAGPEPGSRDRPLDCVDPCAAPAAMRGHLESACRGDSLWATAGINAQDDALGTEPLRGVAEKRGIVDRGRVDTDLVGSSAEQAIEVVDHPDAAADRQRDEDCLRSTGDDVVRRRPIGTRCGDVEEHQLIGTGVPVCGGQFDRIARIAELDEVDALDDPPRIDVQAGDHPDGQAHGRAGPHS